MRKNFILTALCLLFAIATTGCSSDSDDRNTLELDTSSLSFAYDEVGQPQSVSVDTDASSRSVITRYKDLNDQNWLEIDRPEGSFDIVVTVLSRNEGATRREATLTVKAGNSREKTIEVTQGVEGDDPGEFTITVTGPDMEFGWEETNNDKALTVTTDAPDGIKTPTVNYADPADIDWLDVEIDPRDNTRVLVATTSKNLGENDRKATIVVSANGAKSKSVPVTQSAREPDYSITFENGENTEEITLNHDYDLTQTVDVTTIGTGLTATPDKTWVKEAKFTGKTLSVTAEENEDREQRTAVIEIVNEQGEKATLNVIQLGVPVFDITGEWTWTSISATHYSELEDAPEISGTATIERTTDDTYTIIGVKGPRTQDWDVDTKFLLQVKEANDGVVIKVANFSHLDATPSFSYMGVNYFSAKTLAFAGFTPSIMLEGDNFICNYSNSGGKETIEFPKTYTLTEEEFPNLYPHLTDYEAKVAYSYYYLEEGRGGVEMPMQTENHKDLVLTRSR